MSDAPDRETSSSSDDESVIDRTCDLCYNYHGNDYLIYPCDCQYGIRQAHLLCFEEYRESWPLNHLNRKFCKFCNAEYNIPTTILTDKSNHRKEMYGICTYIIAHSVAFTVFLCSYDVSESLIAIHSLYTTLMYFTIDFILSTVGVSSLHHRIKLNCCSQLVVTMVIIGLMVFHRLFVLIMYSICVHVAVIRRITMKQLELTNYRC